MQQSNNSCITEEIVHILKVPWLVVIYVAKV